jgi:predicted acyl esterase
VGAATARADDLDALRASCKADRGVTLCAGAVPSFDGTALDATVTLPEGPAPRGGRPLVVFLHGLLADKGEYLSDTAEGTGPDRGGNAYKTIRWNNRWFAARGYAVLNYSARGHGASAGSIELASKNVEVRDARRITGLLADAPWMALNPARIGVIGSSYGGGQAWLLLTTREDDGHPFGAWRSPGGRELRLAALVPGYTWTDLVASLLPNGHEDSRAVTDPATADAPLGVAKQTLLDGFIATAGDRLPTYVRRWLLRTNAGEPYDPASDTTLAEAKNALTLDRSAYFQDGYFAALESDAAARARVFARRARCRRTRSKKRCARAHRMPARRQFRVPVLAAQGWTDPIFAPIEAVRMYTRLRALSPGYPIGMYLGDFEHLTALVKLPDLAAMHDDGTLLLDRALRGRGPKPRHDVRSAVTDCDPGAFGPILRAPTWDALAPTAVTYELAGPKLLTSAATEGRGSEIDPVVASSSRGRGCLTTTTQPSAAAWTVTPQRPFTMAGLPRLTIDLRMTGGDATLISRLWDVAPDGRATLVTRGALRLKPAPTGPVATEMFGNAWAFKPGHQLQLEFTQTDATFFRPDNQPSSIAVDAVRLELPVSSTA